MILQFYSHRKMGELDLFSKRTVPTTRSYLLQIYLNTDERLGKLQSDRRLNDLEQPALAMRHGAGAALRDRGGLQATFS